MKQSIHFGLNVVDPDAYGGWNGWLNACVNDARDMASLCARAGYQARAVFNLDVTRERARSELQSAAASLVAHDTFLLSYSGHGGRPPAWTWPGYTETLCLADGELADTALREMLAAFAPGVRVIVILDSCHSGGMSRTTSLIRAKPAFVKSASPVVVGGCAVRAPSDLAPVVEVPASVLMWSACTAEETALDGDVNGAFTASMLHVADLRTMLAQPFTWETWVEMTQAHMAKFFPAQHPVANRYGAESDWNIEIA